MNIILQRLDDLEHLLRKQQKPFLNVKECSQYLDVSVNTIYQWTSTSLIPHYKLGKKLLFKVTEIDDWILSHRHRVKTISELDKEIETDFQTVSPCYTRSLNAEREVNCG